ncbi:MAG TPA: DMT family transporter [Terriglobia bacterium]|nr:DMT family transporter [Terriglobia bacterium]
MSLQATLKTPWFWYSVLCVLCWGAWTIFEKLGSNEIPDRTVQFLFTFGALPVAFGLLFVRRFKLEKSPRGILCGLGNGVLAGIGNAALAGAYRSGGNTSVITAATAMYPLITVLLAVTLLRERLTNLHKLGLLFAAAAFVIFSL